MNSDKRNTQVLVALIVSMTLGAGLLKLLESPVPKSADLLAAVEGKSVATLTVGVVRGVNDPALASFESYIDEHGACHWRQEGADVRLAIVGDPAQRLSEPQAVMLLQMIATLRRERGLELRAVRLATTAGDTEPAMMRDMREMLERKGMLR